MEPAFEVNGKRYPVPENLTLGEMCDAEQFFGVEFGEKATVGIRMITAMLWIAVKRVDPSVTIDDIRDLPPDVFQTQEDDASPPDEETVAGTSSTASTSGDGSVTTSDDLETIPAISGVPG